MIVGIDLGTTNSLIGVWRDGKSILIPNALGGLLTPSVVSADESGCILVGQPARDRLVSNPDGTAAAFKRYMGTEKEIAVGGRRYRAEELSALVLRALKADAEAFLGEPVTQAVITVPAYFNDSQRKATRTAAELAGLKVDRLLTEPTAAALAYGFAVGDDDISVLVIDLGGGTLDVSLLHSFEGIMEVKATAGDIWLGGEDFTDVIAAAFLREAGEKIGIPPASKNLPVHGAIRRQAERVKRTLSDSETATLEVNFNDAPVQWTLSREHYEQLAEPLLARIRLPLERALRDARIEPGAIDRVIFAGGASRMPMFRRMISRLLRQLPIQHINPDEVVAMGAAVRAGLAAKSVGLEEHVLTDVSPFTLGVEVTEIGPNNVRLDGLFLPIIERNTIIPASRSHMLRTIHDAQHAVKVRIYQGESRMVQDNTFLGELEVYVPPGPAGKEAIEVRFSYDTSGLLDVDVTVMSQNKRENLLIEGNPGVLSTAEVQRRLAALSTLKVHPRDDAENRAVISRAKRLYEEHLGDLRAQVGEALNNFMAVLERQEPGEVAAVRENMTRYLDSIDRSILS